MPTFTIVTTLLSIALVLGLTALLWRMNDPGKRRDGDGGANTGDSAGGAIAPIILVDPGHARGDRHPDADQNVGDQASDGGGSGDGGGGGGGD